MEIKDILVVHEEDYTKETANDLAREIGKLVIMLPIGSKGIESVSIEDLEDLLEKLKKNGINESTSDNSKGQT